MTEALQIIINNWVAAPTARDPAQAMIAAVKADSLPMALLQNAMLAAPWDKTSHAAKWSRLFIDAAVCAGFHHSDGWWIEQLSKLPSGDIRALPILVAREATKYVESEWRPDWPMPESVLETFKNRSTHGFLRMLDTLSSANPEHPVTQGVLLYLSTLPRWAGPDGNPASAMDIAARAWPRHKAAAASVVSLFDTVEEQVRQFSVMASRTLDAETPTLEDSGLVQH